MPSSTTPRCSRPAFRACEELIKSSDTEMSAVAVTKIGPGQGRASRARVHLTDLDPPQWLPHFRRRPMAAFAGFAKGGASVALTEKRWRHACSPIIVEAQIGGKLAQLGQRLVNGAAKKIADDFFQEFWPAYVGRAPQPDDPRPDDPRPDNARPPCKCRGGR